MNDFLPLGVSVEELPASVYHELAEQYGGDDDRPGTPKEPHQDFTVPTHYLHDADS